MISRKFNEKANVIGNIISDLRKSKKMSRATLSNKLMMLGIDINGDGIYKIEKGSRIIKDFELAAFSIVLEVPESDLLKNFRNELLK
ncbi:MAG: helix-turn-helix transcriptional regulator [Clostridia bacterium]|nr:helix-turn-helix transcriptional regulator [Clostridia bacterium]